MCIFMKIHWHHVLNLNLTNLTMELYYIILIIMYTTYNALIFYWIDQNR